MQKLKKCVYTLLWLIFHGELGEEAGECAGIDGFTRFPHQLLIKRDVVNRKQRISEHFTSFNQMAQIRSAEVPARIALTILIKWFCVESVLRVADFDLAVPRERLPVPRIARRDDAVEHVNATSD